MLRLRSDLFKGFAKSSDETNANESEEENEQQKPTKSCSNVELQNEKLRKVDPLEIDEAIKKKRIASAISSRNYRQRQRPGKKAPPKSAAERSKAYRDRKKEKLKAAAERSKAYRDRKKQKLKAGPKSAAERSKAYRDRKKQKLIAVEPELQNVANINFDEIQEDPQTQHFEMTDVKPELQNVANINFDEIQEDPETQHFEMIDVKPELPNVANIKFDKIQEDPQTQHFKSAEKGAVQSTAELGKAYQDAKKQSLSFNLMNPNLVASQLHTVHVHDERGDLRAAQCTLANGTKIIMVSISISPGQSIANIQDFIHYVLLPHTEAGSKILKKNYHEIPMIIAGDFKVNFANDESLPFIKFLKDNFNLEMATDRSVSTIRHGTTIDVVFARFIDNLSANLYASRFIYHRPIVTILEKNVSVNNSET